MKKVIRLTEGDLHNIIKESVKKIIREGFEDDFNAARDNHVGRGGMFGLEMKIRDYNGLRKPMRIGLYLMKQKLLIFLVIRTNIRIQFYN